MRLGGAFGSLSQFLPRRPTIELQRSRIGRVERFPFLDEIGRGARGEHALLPNESKANKMPKSRMLIDSSVNERYPYVSELGLSLGCIFRRMPRMQVYLPDELYKLVKAKRLPASELLQEAVRAEARRRELLAETDKYLDELTAKVGAPSARHRAKAKAVVQRIVGPSRRKAG
ncbi:MAG: hypothetical protein ABW133_23320 [Polyangiaceae bacterium]